MKSRLLNTAVYSLDSTLLGFGKLKRSLWFFIRCSRGNVSVWLLCAGGPDMLLDPGRRRSARATAVRQRFFAGSETALSPLPALRVRPPGRPQHETGIHP